jgi:hypothetical protein
VLLFPQCSLDLKSQFQPRDDSVLLFDAIEIDQSMDSHGREVVYFGADCKLLDIIRREGTGNGEQFGFICDANADAAVVQDGIDQIAMMVIFRFFHLEIIFLSYLLLNDRPEGLELCTGAEHQVEEVRGVDARTFVFLLLQLLHADLTHTHVYLRVEGLSD